jgi:hypothetical protein
MEKPLGEVRCDATEEDGGGKYWAEPRRRTRQKMKKLK